MTVGKTIFCIKCHYGWFHYAEFRDLFIVMLNVVMLSVVALFYKPTSGIWTC